MKEFISKTISTTIKVSLVLSIALSIVAHAESGGQSRVTYLGNEGLLFSDGERTVSYTHLTLPTKA